MTVLQASFLVKPLLFLPCSHHPKPARVSLSHSFHTLSLSPSSLFLLTSAKSISFTSPSRRLLSAITPCTLNPQESDSDTLHSSSDQGLNSVDGDTNWGPEAERLKTEDVGTRDLDDSLKLEEKVSEVEVKDDDLEAAKESAWEESRFPVVAFLVGLWARMRKGIEKVPFSKPMGLWNWMKESRLERLMKEADASPSHAAKQSALLVELSKHSPDAVIERFEDRQYAVDSRGVVEYLRALVATDTISEYLPDEKSGKPSGLPTLLLELKQRASGNMDDSLLTPGISERQPLHVVMPSKATLFAQEVLSTILFTVALGFIWVLGAAALQNNIGGLTAMGKSGFASSSAHFPKELNKEVKPEKNVKTFKDVKGCDDAKQELEEVVEYLKNPAKFTRLGGKLPKGILLTGAPGTGKTLLAKAIAGEAGVPFFYSAGSEFEEMFVGVGARRVRSLFQAAKKKAPCIIFIDEIDAIGSTRKQWEGHTKETLHQLLVEMDGFEQNEGIILMAATTLPDILDPALTRPGRFDRHIVVPSPDVRGRQEILELYLQDKPVADDVDVKTIARGTPGFNGADLANLVNIAAIKAAVEGEEKLTASQLEFAKDRILMDTERKTMFISEENKKRASGNIDDSLLSPGISERQPLHVVMVDPKQPSKATLFAQDALSTILSTVTVGFIWVLGAAALQKYIGGLTGMGKSGVASSSTHIPKEPNKEVEPEKDVKGCDDAKQLELGKKEFLEMVKDVENQAESKELTMLKNDKTFKDVKGCDDAKQELQEVVEYLKNPAKFTRLGGKLPKGILLTGAPGTGKTLLAKAIAGEAGVPFFYRAGSEFDERFVGVGARRVRSLFQAAKNKAPCIIFIDEIDAVGSTRREREGHTKETLHQLLVEMDGFEENGGIILIAATNLPDILDPALTRPGRFDRHIFVPRPDVRGRREILELYLQDKPVADDVDVKTIARGTPGFNGADLANLVNIAAIKAAVEGAEKLTASQLEFAKDRILMGAANKTRFISEENKKVVAYHESGHAIVAFNTEGARPIYKATIVPHGSALGKVARLRSSDATSVSKKQLLACLDVCMGGRVAEEMIFGQDHVTTGAKKDLFKATNLAKYMVTTCGMSDAIGPIHISKPGGAMQKLVDAEVMKMAKKACRRVKHLLQKHEKALHALANELLERETLTGKDIQQILLPFQEQPQPPTLEQQEQEEPSLEQPEHREQGDHPVY